MALRRVDLPHPEGPIDREELPLSDTQVDLAERLYDASLRGEPDGQSGDLDRRRHVALVWLIQCLPIPRCLLADLAAKSPS